MRKLRDRLMQFPVGHAARDLALQLNPDLEGPALAAVLEAILRVAVLTREAPP
jgi:hypothetical protein